MKKHGKKYVKSNRLATMAMVLMFSLAQPGIAVAWGEDCEWYEYECLYNAAKAEIIRLNNKLEAEVNKLKGELAELTEQLLAPNAIAEELAETITGADLAFLGLDAKSMDSYMDALNFVRKQNDKLSGEFEYFAGDPDCSVSPVCKLFRNRLAETIYLVSDVTDEANRTMVLQHELEGLPPVPPLLLNSEGLGDFVAQAPPVLLFPLYYMINSTEAGSGSASGQSTMAAAIRSSTKADDCNEGFCEFFDRLDDMMFRVLADLTGLDTQLKSAKTSLEENGPPRDPLCTVMFSQPSLPDEISKYASITAVSAQILAELGGWLGKPKVTLVPSDYWIGAVFGGDVEVEYKVDLGKRFGIHLRRLSVPLRMLGESTSARVSDCRQRLEQYLAICSIAQDIKKNDTFRQCKVEILFTDHEYGF